MSDKGKAAVKASPLATHVVIGIPSSGRACPLEMVLAIAQQAWPANCGVGWNVVCGAPVADARNRIVETSLEYNPKYIWFIDDDTIPPVDAARKLIYVLEQSELNGTKVAVCGGVYTYKREPAEPLVFDKLNSGPFWKWKRGEVFPVWGMGAGCMMIRADVFQHIPRPWFVMGAEANGAKWGEDLYFCHAVHEAGFRVMAHGGVLCRHWDMAEMQVYTLPEDSYPMQPRSNE